MIIPSIARSSRPARLIARLLVALVMVMPLCAMAQDTPAPPVAGKAPAFKAIRLATALTEGTYLWRLAELIYTEAFGRLGYRFELYHFPIERALLEADAGRIDGDVARVRLDSRQAAQYPHLIRVPESVYQMKLVACTMDPTLHVDSWEALARKKLIIGLLRGYKSTEAKFSTWIDPKSLIEVGSIPSGLQMLERGRVDVLIAAQGAVAAILASPESKDRKIVMAGVIESVPLFPYLNRQHKDLVPRLAAALKAMKAEGTYQRLDASAKTGRP